MTDQKRPSSGTFAEGYETLRKQERETELERRRSLYMQRHHVSQLKDIPKTSHFAVLTQESRTYPDSYEPVGSGRTTTDQYLGYIAFDSQEALDDWLKDQHKQESYSRTKYVVIRVNPVEVEIRTSISIKE